MWHFLLLLLVRMKQLGIQLLQVHELLMLLFESFLQLEQLGNVNFLSDSQFWVLPLQSLQGFFVIVVRLVGLRRSPTIRLDDLRWWRRLSPLDWRSDRLLLALLDALLRSWADQHFLAGWKGRLWSLLVWTDGSVNHLSSRWFSAWLFHFFSIYLSKPKYAWLFIVVI